MSKGYKNQIVTAAADLHGSVVFCNLEYQGRKTGQHFVIIACAATTPDGRIPIVGYLITSNENKRRCDFPRDYHRLPRTNHSFLKHDSHVVINHVHKGWAEHLIGKRVLVDKLDPEEFELIRTKTVKRFMEDMKTASTSATTFI